MNTRKVVNLFFKTLAIGGLVGLIVSFFVNIGGAYTENLQPFNLMGLVGVILFFIGHGLLYSVVSQTGFFAYLYVHRLGLSIFRSFWPIVQVVLIIFVLFDLVYFPYKGSDGEVSLIWFILGAFLLLTYSWIIAKIKAKETKAHAFIPALFFMVVFTVIEWVPALRIGFVGADFSLIMVLTLLACNTYQLLILHRLHNSPKAKK
ncbi:KinB-signaling pathway activation protein [Ornithinibacillus halotolerans]|uniref:KinB-signaling pathway activation protein n=1 Tax=Ornithinibacillus halotolerans TaxID=1274357 RepID=A0A916WDE7_9BACI|nr:KinB-signaling pathway activation protein [Ornithinibacillus halotolerans]GGA87977.1 KinB-signaling pathway activation protein [Ornithinibacillus halotolerans]